MESKEVKILAGFQLLLLYVIFNGVEVECFSKNWIWSTKWNDPKNWDKNRLPCSSDQIVLAEGVIYLDKNATFSSLELTNNGELVFNENSELTIEETPKAGSSSKDCPGEPLRFIGNTPRDWFNPLNWKFLENGAVAAWNDGSLYVDRIPCNYDNVYFPEANAFVVSLGSNAQVSEVFLGKKSYNSAQLTTYLASSEGKKSFKRKANSMLTASQKSCQQNVGCPCGYAKMKKTICSTFVCPPACENKVTPEGDCCARCGALVKMDITPEFNLNSCQSVLRSRLSKKNFKKAMLFISPIDKNNAVEKVQILVTDKYDGKEAVSAAKETAQYLSEGAKVKECSSFNVKVVTVDSDGGTTGKTTGGKKSSSSTIALAVTLSIVLVILLLGGLYLLRRRRYRGGNNLNVLHNEMDISGSRNIEMKDTDFIKDVLDFDSKYGKGLSSFDNPMYDDMMDVGPAVIEPKIDTPNLEPVYAKPMRKSNEGEDESQKKKKKKKEKNGKSSKSKSKSSESNDAFENPVYGTVQFTPDFDDSFDPAYDAPVPGDSGFSNPLYGEVHTAAKPDDLKEAMATEPPSFLDVIGFTPTDKGSSVLNDDDVVFEDAPKINVEFVGEDELGFKGESDA